MSEIVDCRRCNGTGQIKVSNDIGPLAIGTKKDTCPACHGSGKQRV